MFWLGKRIKKNQVNGSCIAKYMQNEQYKHASSRKLQCGHARGGNQDSDASNTSLPVKCTSCITFLNSKNSKKHIQACVSDKQSFSSQQFWAKNAPIKLSDTGEECICLI